MGWAQRRKNGMNSSIGKAGVLLCQFQGLRSFAQVCAVFAQCLHNVCAMFAQCLRNVCAMLAQCVRNVCALFAQCLRNVCAVFAQCLRNVCAGVGLRRFVQVCAMFAQCLRNVCAGLRKGHFFSENSHLRKHCLRFAQVCASLRVFVHIVRKHENVCAMFAHVCAGLRCLRAGQLADGLPC